MAIKLKSREDTVFRNELIFACDAKTINIDNTFINLFMLLKHNGIRPRQKARAKSKSIIDIERLVKIFKELENNGDVSGSTECEDGLRLWLRSNLSNMTQRGRMDKERISSLLPIHLESYRVRNAAHCRDYFSADQLYLMLSADPRVKDELKQYLGEGWDQTTDKLTANSNVDVDCLGVLHLIKNIKPGYLDSSSSINKLKPLLEKSAKNFCEDIHRLLVYRDIIPRNVLLGYIKTISAFHLSLYFRRVVLELPRIILSKPEVKLEDFDLIVDLTDDPSSKMASISGKSVEEFTNRFYDYIRAGFMVNCALKEQNLDNNDSDNFDKAVERLKERPGDFEAYFRHKWSALSEGIEEDDKERLLDLSKYEDKYFDKFLEVLVHTRGAYLYKYHLQMFDSLALKNSAQGFLSQGRSKKNPRRFVLGVGLLETLVQVMVLRLDGDKFKTSPIGIEDFIDNLYSRYGVIVDGSKIKLGDNDISSLRAYKNNVDSLKSKLRQIGFYDDLSDAQIMQKISPRYEIR